MYFPWIGFTLGITALLEYVIRTLAGRALWPGRLVILSVGIVFLAGILTLAGFAQVYRLRAEYDQRQISALMKAAPNIPRDTRIVLLPIHLDERSVTFSTRNDSLLDKYLFGVYETHWSAKAATQMAYKYPEIEAITSNRWDHLRFTEVHTSLNGNVDQIVVNGRPAAINQVLAFTYEDDKVVLLSPLVLASPDGAEVNLPLPLVERVRTSTTEVRRIRLQLEPIANALKSSPCGNVGKSGVNDCRA